MAERGMLSPPLNREEEAEGKGAFSGKSFEERNLGNEGVVDRDSEKDTYASRAWIRRG
jgi:hypothetical protein